MAVGRVPAFPVEKHLNVLKQIRSCAVAAPTASIHHNIVPISSVFNDRLRDEFLNVSWIFGVLDRDNRNWRNTIR